MSSTTEIITTTEIIDLAIPLKAGFEPRYLSKWILKAQRQYIRPFLGDDFYEEITDQVENTTLTADNTALLDNYLKPMLAHYVVYERLPMINDHISNSGTMSDFNEFSNASGNTGKGLVRNQMLADAGNFEEQADQFIKDEQEDDSTKYPLYGCGERNVSKYFFINY